jgi:hypothetical protein
MNNIDKNVKVAEGMHRQQPLSESCAVAQKRWVQTPSPAPQTDLLLFPAVYQLKKEGRKDSTLASISRAR